MIDRRIGKIKIRRGTEAQRSNIIFEEGELIYSVDKKRMFIGDGAEFGGILVSNRNYVVSNLGNPALPPSAALEGDIIYEKDTSKTYITAWNEYKTALILILMSDGNCCAILQAKINDLYTKIRSLTASLSACPDNPLNPSNPSNPNNFSWVIQPISLTKNIGETALFTASAVGTGIITYQWARLDTGNILGAIKYGYDIINVQIPDTANYVCIATSSIMGNITSNPVSLIVIGNSILAESGEYVLSEASEFIDWSDSGYISPFITTQPRSQTTTPLTPITFSVVADGTPPLSYQWSISGVDMPLEISQNYIATNPTRDVSLIKCKISNIAGDVFTIPASLTIIY